MPTATELNVTQTNDAATIADTIFGDDITVVSSSLSGTAGQSGVYSGGDSTSPGAVPGDSGVILSTGNVGDFTNSSGTTDTNTSDSTSTNHGGTGDAGLTDLSGNQTYDAVVFEATFIPEGDTLTMQFTFSSEEYLEYVNGGVNDTLGVWVNGTFTPITPDGETVSIDTVNDSTNQNLYIDNPAASDPYNTEMDGFTVTLSFKAPVNAGEENTIRIGLADGGDGAYDTNVLIAADSVQSTALAFSDTIETGPNSSAVIDVLANDVDNAGLGLTVTEINGVAVVPGDTVTLSTGEQVTLNPDGTLTVLTDGDITSSTFTYMVEDANGVTDVGYVTVETVASPAPDGYVDGTADADLIDGSYTGDPNGDLVDNNDSLGVEGTTGDGDVINAFGGDDVIQAGAGDDIVYGGSGDDTIAGGTGEDSLFGGSGNDTLTFAEGDTADGGDGDDTFVLEDLGEPTNGAITLTGGDADETLGGGDTLQLGDLADLSTLTITGTTTNASGNTSQSGTVTLDDGTLLTFSGIENIICFTPGTRIATARGAIPVEQLQKGDMVITRDHGLQPVRWIEARTVPATGRFAPVRIDRSVLTGLQSDLVVSPQHRVLFQGYRAELLFGETEVLAAAAHLVDGSAVTRAEGTTVTYVHFLLDQHEIVFAEGAATESFHPGNLGVDAVSDAAREELFALFPGLRSDLGQYGDTARRCLKAHEAQLIRD